MILQDPSTEFKVISAAGFRLLEAFNKVSRALGLRLRVTAGTNGAHSGPLDPHYFGSAYDAGSHEFSPEQKSQILLAVMTELGDPKQSSGGLITAQFFGWLEAAGTPNEHFHFQLRHGVEYTDA